jgi:hypothetical protein
MKVDIQHVEKSQGLIFRKTLHGVALTVRFSEEERQIIQQRRLQNQMILERDIPADVNPEKVANRGLVKSLATAAINGRDSLHYHLTIGKLINGTDTYFFDTPLEAKEYEAELRERLPKFKEYLTENAGIDQKSDSFEL